MSRKSWILDMLEKHEKSSSLLMARIQNMDDGTLETLSTREARRAYNMAREVVGESHRMVSYIRFQMYKEKVLWAEAMPRHRVEEMTMFWLGKRYSCFGLVLSTPRGIYVVSPGERLMMEPAGRIESVLEDVASRMVGNGVWWKDRGEGLWDTYYDSQYISSRKNLPLFHKVLPKKCLETFPGLAKEKRGVGTMTLDSYIEDG